ncbi:hypothetical protein KFU94_02505 [Chloroflexi bacterium TSY]|nr:hypothetical protein [Chloroflexi bacterium TSY]
MSELSLPELSWVTLEWFYQREEETPPGIYLGNGEFLEAEDVLEGHFRRLSQQSSTEKSFSLDNTKQNTFDQNPSKPNKMEPRHPSLGRQGYRYQSVNSKLQSSYLTTPIEQTDCTNLTEAISALSPKLAPFAELAEDVAETVSPVEPEPQFRAHLQQALERAHQQQSAQRELGILTEMSDEESSLWRLASRPTVMAGIPIVVGLIVYVWYNKDNEVKPL